MKRYFFMLTVVSLCGGVAQADEQVLFDGSNFDHWDLRQGSWVIEDHAMTCRMEAVKQKNGTTKQRGMGYIWSKKAYADFKLSLSYKLSPGANSGVFYRTDKDNPVQGGFEIQLMDNEGFQKAKKKALEPKKLNGSFYDAKAPAKDSSRPIGQWNDLVLTCNGPRIALTINDADLFSINVDDWDTAGKNPDGSSNKFKTALKDLPRTGRIGFQNHGQVVSFRNVKIEPIK